MKNRKEDLITNLVIGGCIAAAVLALGLGRGYDVLRCFCDGFFVSAVMLIGIGGIKEIRNKGTFDVVGYGMKRFIEVAIPMLNKGDKESMYDYRERKAKERKGAFGMLIAGTVYLVLALVFLGLFYLFNGE